jgi:ABC-2 type transport system permease protein
MFFLQLRNELWKLYGKKRTYIGFGMFILAQNLIFLAFKMTTATEKLSKFLDSNGYFGQNFITAPTIAVIAMLLIAIFLVPLYSALIGGDLVAKEIEDGTMRMILCRPISRFRLLLVKWISGCIFSVSLVIFLGLVGIISARLWFPWGGLFVMAPEHNLFSVFEAGEGFQRYLVAHLFMVVEPLSIMTLALMFSCFNVKPAAATILAMSIMLISFILQQIPYFRDYHNWILTYHLNLWVFSFEEHIPWWRLGESLSLLVGFNLSFFIIGASAFHMRDVKS